jgi:SPX domain protein involved in polyphosphate accumulation
MSHRPKISLDQSLMARIEDQNKNGMHGKISTTVPNHSKSQIKDAVRNNTTFWLHNQTVVLCVTSQLPHFPFSMPA